MPLNNKQNGAILTEYMLLTFLIAILLISVVSLIGEDISSTLQFSADTVEEEFES
ncbi:MAG: Flp family type IVb pilin [Pseudomonadota bacterium]